MKMLIINKIWFKKQQLSKTVTLLAVSTINDSFNLSSAEQPIKMMKHCNSLLPKYKPYKLINKQLSSKKLQFRSKMQKF